MEHHQKMLSLEAAADVLKVGVPTIQQLIDSGALPAHEEHAQVRIAYEDLVAFLQADQRALFSEDAPVHERLDNIEGDRREGEPD